MTEFDCACCGHTNKPCGCSNSPDPWDKCHNAHYYGCTLCGRQFVWNHHDSVTPIGLPCSGKDCDGTLCRKKYGIGNRRY